MHPYPKILYPEAFRCFSISTDAPEDFGQEGGGGERPQPFWGLNSVYVLGFKV